MEPVRSEEILRSSLRRMKGIATGLLALMAGALFLSIHFEATHPQLVWLRVFSEAALIGGLADWFAVTALFRYPLGLPIPHTAIIPRGKARIGENLGQFIQSNFLTPGAVGEKLKSFNSGERLARWLSSPEVGDKIAGKISGFLPDLLDALDDKEVQRLLETNLRSFVSATKAAPFCGRLLALFASGEKFEILFAGLLDLLEMIMEERADLFRDALKNEVPWYVPGFMHSQVFEGVKRNIRKTLREVRANPRHSLRLQFQSGFESFVEKLLTSDEYLKRGEEIKARLLASNLPPEYISKVWEEIKRAVRADLTGADQRMRAQLAGAIVSFGGALARNSVLQQKVNSALVRLSERFITAYSADIRGFIADTVSRWDEKTITERIELHVGKDLQFIRLNGTLVGGLVGVLIYAVSIWVY